MALTDTMFPARAVGAERVILAGNLKGNGTTAPVAADYEGIPGASWSRSGVGTYVLTLPGKGTVDVMSVVAFLQGGTGSVRASARDDAARTITFVVRTEPTDVAAAADRDLATTDYLHVQISVKNSNLINA